MADLTFYTNPMSRGRIVRWMLEEVGEDYRTQVLSYGPAMNAESYRAINPMAKVPAIRHGDVVVTEAAAICAYLADAFPEAGLAPPRDSVRRGPYYRWLFFGAGPVEAAVTNRAFGFDVPAGKEGSTGYGTFARVMDALEGWLADGRPFWLGDAFTAADVYMGSSIGWGLAFKTMEERAGFRDYWDRIAARPAAIRAREIDDALMAENG